MAMPQDKENEPETKQELNNEVHPVFEETPQDSLQKLSEALGINSMREDQDESNKKIDGLITAVNEIAQAVNGLNSVVTQKVQTGEISASQVPSTPQNEKFKGLMDIVNSPVGDRLLNKLDPPQNQNPNPMAGIFDQNFLVEKMKKSFLDDLETGESIRKFISDSLKRKATKEIVNKSLKSMGDTEQIDHGA